MNKENQPQTPEQIAPSKEEVMKFLKEQIQVKKLQAELQKLNTEIAVGRADELEAFAKIAHYSKQQPQEEMVEHEVTQADLDNNKELRDNNVKVGDKIGIPKAAYESFLQSAKEVEEKITGEKPAMSVVK